MVGLHSDCSAPVRERLAAIGRRAGAALAALALAFGTLLALTVPGAPPARAAGTLTISASPSSPTTSDAVTFTATVTGCGVGNTSTPSLYYYVTGPTTLNNYYSSTVLSDGGDTASASVTFAAGSVPAGNYSMYAYGRGTPCFASGYEFTWTSATPLVVASGASVPGAPGGVVGVAGDGEVSVSWDAAAANGAAVTGYSVTASPGGASCVTAGSLSCVVSGLTNGVAYTFSVTATNSVGTGPASAASDPVTPVAPAFSVELDLEVGADPRGTSFMVRGRGLQIGSTATVEVHSTPRTLASPTAGLDGAFDASVTLPSDLEPGTHAIVVSGVAASGAPVGVSVSFEVPAPASDTPDDDAPDEESPDRDDDPSEGAVGDDVLPRTGLDATRVAQFALALVVFGAVLARRPRRARTPVS